MLTNRSKRLFFFFLHTNSPSFSPTQIFISELLQTFGLGINVLLKTRGNYNGLCSAEIKWILTVQWTAGGVYVWPMWSQHSHVTCRVPSSESISQYYTLWTLHYPYDCWLTIIAYIIETVLYEGTCVCVNTFAEVVKSKIHAIKSKDFRLTWNE